MADQIPQASRNIVDDRDHGHCRLRGWFAGRSRNFHHRKLRSQGGLHGPGNLVSLSGSGTTGSHGWVHANPAEARRLGFIVPSFISDPQTVPIRLTDAQGNKTWALLRDSGRVVDLTPKQAELIMLELGIWTNGELF